MLHFSTECYIFDARPTKHKAAIIFASFEALHYRSLPRAYDAFDMTFAESLWRRVAHRAEDTAASRAAFPDARYPALSGASQ